MRLACAQLAAVPFERERNLEAAERMVQNAADQGSQFIVLPESFATGYEYHERICESAEGLDGCTLQWMKSISRQKSVWLAGGFVERAENQVYNSLALVSPAGRTWIYRKRYLPFFEVLYFSKGRDVGIFETEIGRIGVMLCWDMIHGRLLSELEGRIDMLVLCSAWPDVRTGSIRLPGLETWLSRPPLNRPRELAAQLDVPVIHCSMAGRFATRVPGLGLRYSADFTGTSTIIDRGGNGAIGPHREESLIISDVNLDGGGDANRRWAA